MSKRHEMQAPPGSPFFINISFVVYPAERHVVGLFRDGREVVRFFLGYKFYDETTAAYNDFLTLRRVLHEYTGHIGYGLEHFVAIGGGKDAKGAEILRNELVRGKLYEDYKSM